MWSLSLLVISKNSGGWPFFLASTTIAYLVSDHFRMDDPVGIGGGAMGSSLGGVAGSEISSTITGLRLSIAGTEISEFYNVLLLSLNTRVPKSGLLNKVLLSSSFRHYNINNCQQYDFGHNLLWHLSGTWMFNKPTWARWVLQTIVWNISRLYYSISKVFLPLNYSQLNWFIGTNWFGPPCS